MFVLLWLATAGAQDVPRAPDSSGAPSHVRAAAAADRTLDSLVARARATNPSLNAARARAAVAEHRIAPAGARPDPMLMLGVQNVPVAEPGFAEAMTMKMVGVSQMIPRRGKLASRTRMAEHEARAARFMSEGAALDIAAAVQAAYYDVARIDATLGIVGRTRDVLASLIDATQARYEVAAAGQQDVIRARLELTRLADEASALHEARHAVVARLNALLDQSSDVPLAAAAVPTRVARAGVASPERIGFVSPALGSRAADSPLPSVDSLERIALDRNPMLRARQAMVDAQAARVEMARLERQPDISVSLQYGQRDGFDDMVTAAVTIPIPAQRRRNQDALLAAEQAEREAMQLELRQERAMVRSAIGRLHAELERARTQLALIARAMLPQSRAALEAAVAAYQSGRAEFVTVLDAQAALFTIETSYTRGLSDFATALAELERTVGAEVLP